MCALLLAASGISCDESPELSSTPSPRQGSAVTQPRASATPPPTEQEASPSPPAGGASASSTRAEIDELQSLEPDDDPAPASFRGRTAAGLMVRVRLATRSHPHPHRGALALYRLARALELTVVPPTAARRLTVARLAELLERHPNGLAELRQHALVGNDGAIMALLQGECRGRSRHVGLSEPVVPWSEWARSPKPPDGSARQTVRDYVQWATLDYLAGNVERRFVRIDEETGRLCLNDNDSAFPGVIGAEAADLLLRRLRPVASFPAALADALRRFDRAAARRQLQSGAFEDWLLGPRELTDLHERRSTLLTLVVARSTKAPRSITPE